IVVMKHTKIRTACLVAALLILAACSSGTSSSAAVDPLSGTWVGEWGPSPSRQTEVTVELKWDGTTLSGTVDPERRPFELQKGSFDPKTKAIRMELDGPNSLRETVHYVIEGKVSGTSM